VSAVRAGDWKLLEYLEEGRLELYNLRDDLSEKTDLAAQMPDKAASLLKQLNDWRTQVGAAMPAPNPAFK
jgi:arylsulfatase A-like enzyme